MATAFPVYGSDDLVGWHRLGRALRTEHWGSHWAPCVRWVPGLARPYVMLYSRAIGVGEEGHIGHAIRRADATKPEGPFVDSGHALTPDLDFAIDPDVYRLPDGSLKVAFAMDFVADEPYGTGIVEADIDEALTELRSAPRVLARPRFDWQVYEPARVMPWKSIPGNRLGAPHGSLAHDRGTRRRPRLAKRDARLSLQRRVLLQLLRGRGAAGSDAGATAGCDRRGPELRDPARTRTRILWSGALQLAPHAGGSRLPDAPRALRLARFQTPDVSGAAPLDRRRTTRGRSTRSVDRRYGGGDCGRTCYAIRLLSFPAMSRWDHFVRNVRLVRSGGNRCRGSPPMPSC